MARPLKKADGNGRTCRGRFPATIPLSYPRSLCEAADRRDLFSNVLAGEGGYGLLNREARMLVPTTKGDVEIIIPEKEWRAIVAAQAQALIERLKAAGVEAPALRSPRQKREARPRGLSGSAITAARSAFPPVPAD